MGVTWSTTILIWTILILIFYQPSSFQSLFFFNPALFRATTFQRITPDTCILVVITIYLLRRTEKCKKKEVYGDSSLVVAQYTVPNFKQRFLRNMLFEGKMGIKLISQGKICVYLLHCISFCCSLFALCNERRLFFNLEVLVPCYSHV